jgi:surface antigen
MIPERISFLVLYCCLLLIPPLHAENICSETVPATRNVDGFPAFAQCSGSTGSVYSNNGIDTRSSSGGTGWVLTQGSGGYQCTEFAHRYLYFRWGVKSVPGGNAGTWGDNTLPSGLEKTTVPVHGDIIVFAPGSCGASTTSGHVAVVDVVNQNGTVTIVEQNGASRRSCQVSCAKWFLHAQSNTACVRQLTNRPSSGKSFEVVQCGNQVIIRMTMPVSSSAPVCVRNLSGRSIAHLENSPVNGLIVWDAGHALPGLYIITAGNGQFAMNKKIVLAK